MWGLMWSLSVILTFLVTLLNGQQHRLKFVNEGAQLSSSAPPQFTPVLSDDQLSNTRNRFANADRVCVAGMWALYNTTDFGQGAEDTTTVISVRGTDINVCTKSGQIPVLKSVQSVHYLGNSDYSMDGLVIYSQPYFLGALWNHTIANLLPPGIRGFPLGSFAITGERAWLFCEDTGTPCNGVCVNMRNYANLYLQRNARADKSLPNGWPKVVRQVRPVMLDECNFYPSPALYNTRKLLKRNTASEAVEVTILELPSS